MGQDKLALAGMNYLSFGYSCLLQSFLQLPLKQLVQARDGQDPGVGLQESRRYLSGHAVFSRLKQKGAQEQQKRNQPGLARQRRRVPGEFTGE